jgi:hypothetical protein
MSQNTHQSAIGVLFAAGRRKQNGFFMAPPFHPLEIWWAGGGRWDAEGSDAAST